MRLSKQVYVVGGGRTGFGLSGRYDCHVYALDGGSEIALFDPGLGVRGDFDTILDNIRADGLDIKRIRRVILTHYHCDHIGAAAEARARLDVEVIASDVAAPAIRNGDEDVTALTRARAAGGYPADYHLIPARWIVNYVKATC